VPKIKLDEVISLVESKKIKFIERYDEKFRKLLNEKATYTDGGAIGKVSKEQVSS
jgi:hypothetical protein